MSLASRFSEGAGKLFRWLTIRRLTAQVVVLAVGLWIVGAVDFATSGVMDRAGNVKFQDYLQFYVGAQLLREGRAAELYNWQTAVDRMHAIAPTWASSLPMVYGPQVAVVFSPLARFSFLTSATIWVAISTLIYLLCCYFLLRVCAEPKKGWTLFWLLTLAYPPFFHFVVRGQLSAFVLLWFVLAYFALREGQEFLAGIALGCLVFKPQFLVAIPVVLLLAGSWKIFVGLVAAASAQLGFTWAYFGTAVMRQYEITLRNVPRLVAATEGAKADVQMHSLRSFWTLLVPWPNVALVLYIVSSVAILSFALRSWRTNGPLALRFSAFVLAAVLVNPHLFVYDLLVLVPVFVLLGNWTLSGPLEPSDLLDSSVPALQALLYGCYVLPLFGPLSLMTHVQASVIVFVILQWELLRILNRAGPVPATVAESRRNEAVIGDLKTPS
jgi:hypothetical protein